MGEILFYILSSSFWMWVVCIIFVCLAIGVYTDEMPIKNSIVKVITIIFLALLAWGSGSVAHENRINNCVNDILKADTETNYSGYYLSSDVVRAICER